MSQFNVLRNKSTILSFRIQDYSLVFLLINNKEKYLQTKTSNQIIDFLTFLFNFKILIQSINNKINQMNKIE